VRTRASWGNGPQLLHVKLPGVASGIGRNVIKLLMMIFSLFFLYRESDTLTGQVARVVDHFFATRLDRYMDAAGLMLKAAILGFLVTAIVQGAISGLGFAVFGVEAPVLLGVLTSVASLSRCWARSWSRGRPVPGWLPPDTAGRPWGSSYGVWFSFTRQTIFCVRC